MSFKQIFSVAFYLPIVAGNAIAFFLGQPQITSKIFRLNSQRFMKCFLNNYYEIHLLAKEILYNGCSAEGHVSHMLSSRMSSRPMGWSAHGAEKIAALRAYKKNNGDMLALVTKKQKQESKPYILPKRKYNKLKTAVQQAATIPVAQIPILNASSHYGTKTLVQKTIQQRLKY